MSSPPTAGPQKGARVDPEKNKHMNDRSEARIRANLYRQNREPSASSSGREERHGRREASLGSGFEAIAASAAANTNFERSQNTSRRNAQSDGSRIQLRASSPVPGLYQANATALANSNGDQEMSRTSKSIKVLREKRDVYLHTTPQAAASPCSENNRMRASESTMALSGLNPIELGQALNWGGPPMNPATYGMTAADFQLPAPGQQGKKIPIPAAGYYGKPSIGATYGGTSGCQPLGYQSIGYQPLGSGNNVSPSRPASPTRQSQNSPTRQSHQETYYDGKPMKYNAAGQAIPRGLTQYFHPPAPLRENTSEKSSTKPVQPHGKIFTTGSQQYGEIKYHGNVDRNALIAVDQGAYPMIPVTIDGVVHKAAVVDPIREIRHGDPGGSRLDRSPRGGYANGQGEQCR